jgi:hypothetical protein
MESAKNVSETWAAQQAETQGAWACKKLGLRFVGIQKMYGIRPDQILFQPTDGILMGSTLAVPVFSAPWAIVEKIAGAEIAAAKVPAAA